MVLPIYITFSRFTIPNDLLRTHCVKSIRIRSSSGPYFPEFGPNAYQNNSEYGHFLRRDIHREKLCFTQGKAVFY